MVRKKTKIVATLGPATSTQEHITRLIREGVNAFRINFSHAKHEQLIQPISIIKNINDSDIVPYKIGIIADLQGPKIRVGEIKPNTFLEKGKNVSIRSDQAFEGDHTAFFINYKSLPQDVKPGDKILIDDGKIILKVLSSDGKKSLEAVVVQGGRLQTKKGVNLPNTELSNPSITEKDIKDVKFAVKHRVDWIALSFVRKAEDVRNLKSLIQKEQSDIPIISKIEKPEAIENIDAILEISDAIMVARGDLGVEIPAAEVPILQKKLIQKCRMAIKPVIVATHMLESMIENMSPTRAEVSDIANACLDGADAVMLSAETSIGKHPARAVRQMCTVIQSIEKAKLPYPRVKHNLEKNPRMITRITCLKAAKTAESIKATAIITLTHSGYTAFEVSSYRPASHILVFTNNPSIINRMSILWGAYAFFYKGAADTDRSIEEVNQIAIQKGMIENRDYVINLSAMPIRNKGFVNTLRISEVK